MRRHAPALRERAVAWGAMRAGPGGRVAIARQHCLCAGTQSYHQFQPLAGMRQDHKRTVHAAQTGDGKYNPVGVGTSWSHNFLNQKPW